MAHRNPKRTCSSIRWTVNACRVLDSGARWRSCVDSAIQQFHSISDAGLRVMDLIDCIQACQHELSELSSSGDSDQARAAARRLGRRYLMRYVLLICFRGYLRDWMRSESNRVGPEPLPSRFKEWLDNRKELSHLLEHCSI